MPQNNIFIKMSKTFTLTLSLDSYATLDTDKLLSLSGYEIMLG